MSMIFFFNLNLSKGVELKYSYLDPKDEILPRWYLDHVLGRSSEIHMNYSKIVGIKLSLELLFLDI